MKKHYKNTTSGLSRMMKIKWKDKKNFSRSKQAEDSGMAGRMSVVEEEEDRGRGDVDLLAMCLGR